MVHAISSWGSNVSIFCHLNELSLKRLMMHCCPQLTRGFLYEPCTNLQVGRCTTVNENRIYEELPVWMRHDFWPAYIRNSCYCDEKKIKLNSSRNDSSYDNE